MCVCGRGGGGWGGGGGGGGGVWGRFNLFYSREDSLIILLNDYVPRWVNFSADNVLNFFFLILP